MAKPLNSDHAQRAWISMLIKEILIPFSNYFAINYFANILSQNFWNKILVISPGGLACGYILCNSFDMSC
jgi:hypothetical protein